MSQAYRYRKLMLSSLLVLFAVVTNAILTGCHVHKGQLNTQIPSPTFQHPSNIDHASSAYGDTAMAEPQGLDTMHLDTALFKRIYVESDLDRRRAQQQEQFNIYNSRLQETLPLRNTATLDCDKQGESRAASNNAMMTVCPDTHLSPTVTKEIERLDTLDNSQGQIPIRYVHF